MGKPVRFPSHAWVPVARWWFSVPRISWVVGPLGVSGPSVTRGRGSRADAQGIFSLPYAGPTRPVPGWSHVGACGGPILGHHARPVTDIPRILQSLLSIVQRALSLDLNPTRAAENTVSASPSFAMAEQILDQVRDVAEGQIVCFSHLQLTPRPPLACAEALVG